jgi:hypothetical protein
MLMNSNVNQGTLILEHSLGIKDDRVDRKSTIDLRN